MPLATQGTSEYDINQLNLAMRQTDWYQNWFRSKGLNPNQVKLNDRQRAELTAVAAQNGYQLGDRMKIDEAGNVNQRGGFSGMPTWAKIAISAAPVAGSMLIPGVREAVVSNIGGLFGGGASTATTGGTGATLTSLSGAPIVAVGAPTAAGVSGTTAGTVAATGSAFNRIANVLKNPITRTVATGAGRMLASAGDAAAQNRGAETAARLDYDRLNLEAEQQGRARQSDAYRKAMLGQLAVGYQPPSRPAGAEGRYAQGFITPEAREAGQTLYGQGMDTLRQGQKPSITPYDQLPTKPGAFERISNYAAPALSIYGATQPQRPPITYDDLVKLFNR